MNDYLSSFITDFFVRYLPNQRGYSELTVSSYKYTFVLLLNFIKEKYAMNINKMIVSDLNKDKVLEFLEFLTNERKNSDSTTNQRLCAIHSFFKYLQIKDIKYLNQATEIINIPTKKVHRKSIYYLNKNQMKDLFSIFDLNNIKQLRDYMIVALIYDSGARVSELINLVSSDINFENNTIRLLGKGSKIRIIPVSSQVICTLKKYFDSYEISINTDQLVFFNSRKIALTRKGVKYILKKYAKLADLDFTKISPHTFRHTKAMHLLENDVNLVYIRDFLGHTSVITTEIYAKANPEIKRKAIENLSNEIMPDEKYTSEEKDELLDWLKQSL